MVTGGGVSSGPLQLQGWAGGRGRGGGGGGAKVEVSPPQCLDWEGGSQELPLRLAPT